MPLQENRGGATPRPFGSAGRGGAWPRNCDTVPALATLREQALELLARNYAAGHVRLATLEHRLDAALRAETLEDLSAVTWDLPALDAGPWQTFKSRLTASPAPSRCSRVCFKTVREVVLDLDAGPRTWVIGRAPTCDVVLCDPAVSRRHALLSVRGGRCSVRDIGSTNGTQLNGEAVEATALRPGDVVSFGDAVRAVVR
jgi:hypothetical protein